MGLMAPEQEPSQRPDSATGHQKTASLPSMLRPIARTAPVPLTGLYGKVLSFCLCAAVLTLGTACISMAGLFCSEHAECKGTCEPRPAV